MEIKRMFLDRWYNTSIGKIKVILYECKTSEYVYKTEDGEYNTFYWGSELYVECINND
jgi:hypothetical protein